jgi:hypothetical protein
LIVQGEGVCLYLFILISFSIEGEGVEVNVLVSPSFDMWKEEGKRVGFFLKFFFFIVEWLRRGVRV